MQKLRENCLSYLHILYLVLVHCSPNSSIVTELKNLFEIESGTDHMLGCLVKLTDHLEQLQEIEAKLTLASIKNRERFISRSYNDPELIDATIICAKNVYNFYKLTND